MIPMDFGTACTCHLDHERSVERTEIKHGFNPQVYQASPKMQQRKYNDYESDDDYAVEKPMKGKSKIFKSQGSVDRRCWLKKWRSKRKEKKRQKEWRKWRENVERSIRYADDVERERKENFMEKLADLDMQFAKHTDESNPTPYKERKINACFDWNFEKKNRRKNKLPNYDEESGRKKVKKEKKYKRKVKKQKQLPKEKVDELTYKPKADTTDENLFSTDNIKEKEKERTIPKARVVINIKKEKKDRPLYPGEEMLTSDRKKKKERSKKIKDGGVQVKPEKLTKIKELRHGTVTEKSTLSERYVNFCYRMCCEFYCWLSCTLIIGTAVVLLL